MGGGQRTEIEERNEPKTLSNLPRLGGCLVPDPHSFLRGGRLVVDLLLQRFNFSAELRVFCLQRLEVSRGRATERLLDELYWLIRALGLLVQIHQHLGEGINNVALLEVLAELLLLCLAGLIRHGFV